MTAHTVNLGRNQPFPEPGLWGVIEASYPNEDADREDWVHRRNGWYCPAQGFRPWRWLVNPVLIRPGIGDPQPDLTPKPATSLRTELRKAADTNRQRPDWTQPRMPTIEAPAPR